MREDDKEVTVFYGEDEKRLIADFWGFIEDFKYVPTIVGFNVFKFDIRFIHIRTMINGLVASYKLRKEYIDLQYELAYFNPPYGTLADYLQTIGETKNGNGTHAIELFRSGDWKHLVEYCKNDVLVTKKLFERCQDAGII
jgi:predicted PolB exonuclease-like 3'-5' exonuclease